jgi:hypothetical protein
MKVLPGIQAIEDNGQDVKREVIRDQRSPVEGA